jgi:hypothetical protein
LLLGFFAEHREAVENGDNGRVRTLEAEINDLLREKVESRNGLIVGSACKKGRDNRAKPLFTLSQVSALFMGQK